MNNQHSLAYLHTLESQLITVTGWLKQVPASNTERGGPIVFTRTTRPKGPTCEWHKIFSQGL